MERKDHLLDLFSILYKWRKIIIGTTVLTAIGAVIVALLLPVFYKSTTIFYAASPDLAKPEAIFGTANNVNYYGEDEDLDRLFSIANSGELKSFLIDSFDLYTHYDIDTSNLKSPYYIGLKIEKLMEVKKNKFDAIVLSVEDEDRLFAANMANAAREKIGSIALDIIRQSQENMIRTFEENIVSANNDLKQLSDSLRIIRKEFNIYNPKTQSATLANQYARAERQKTSAIAKQKVFKNLRGFRDSISLARADEEAAVQEMLQLDVKLDKFNQGVGIVELLMQQHEIAAEEFSDVQERLKLLKSAYSNHIPTLHVVEKAEPAVIKERPKRSIIVLGATMLAFIFSCLGVLLYHHYRDVNWKQVLNG